MGKLRQHINALKLCVFFNYLFIFGKFQVCRLRDCRAKYMTKKKSKMAGDRLRNLTNSQNKYETLNYILCMIEANIIFWFYPTNERCPALTPNGLCVFKNKYKKKCMAKGITQHRNSLFHSVGLNFLLIIILAAYSADFATD